MTSKSRIWVMLAVGFVALLLTTGSARAQTTAGTVMGVVRDSQQAVIPGASITVRSTETGISRQAVSDASGRFRFPQLIPGVYEVQAELSGFRTELRSGLTLNVASEVVVDFVLLVGDVTEKIEVSGEAPLVQTTGSTVSSLVDERALQDLPINGRSFIELARLQEAVNPVRSVTAGAANSYGQHISVAGANPENNNFMMDGTNVSTYQSLGHGGVGGGMPGVEAVKEFRVISHNFSAEYGRGTGAVINAVSKSGTNAFHGSVYEFLRNDTLDAHEWNSAEKDPFKRNQFGFSLGGPVLRNRFFFFVNYEGLRERLGQTERPNVLTADARAGRIQNPATLAFTQVQVSPAIQPFLKLYPMPTPGEQDFHDGSADYIDSYTIPTDKTYVTSRLDYNISPSHWIFARYTYDTGHSIAINDFSHLNYQQDQTPLRYGTLEFNSLISPTMLNTFRFGVAKTPTISDNQKVDVDPSLYLVPLRMATVSTSGLQAIGPNDALLHVRDYKSFELDDNLSYTKGSHSIKVGFMAQRIINNPTIQTRMGGRFTVNSITALLTGAATSSVQFAPAELSSPSRRYRENLFAFFFEDDYQVIPRLTLNLGVRYEFATILKEIDGKFPRLNDDYLLKHRRVITGPDGDGVITGKEAYLSNPDLKNFEPRLGLAYDVSGTGKTSLRAGFGIYHDHVYLSSLAHEFARMYPHNVFNVRNIAYPTTSAAIVGLVPAPPIGNTAIYFANHLDPMYSIHTSLELQHQVGASVVVSAGYLGSRGVHIMGYEEYNAALPVSYTSDGRPVFSLTPVRPAADWDTITYKETGNDSTYNALSLKASKRFSNGLQFQTRYTYSKGIDNASTAKGGGNDGPGSIGVSQKSAWYDKDLDKSISAFDLTHNFTVSYSYVLPIARGAQGLLSQLAGGWNISGVVTRSSGPPITVSQGTNTATTALITGGSRRPDQVPDRTQDDILHGTVAGCPGFTEGQKLGTADRWFDPCAYTFAAPTFWGNVGRNSLRGPGYFNVDFSLNKDWRVPMISESFQVQFRGELYNIFNHPNLSPPSASIANGSNVPSTSAGQITSTVSPARQVQLGLKFVF